MNLQLPGGRNGGCVREFGMDMYTVLYLRWVRKSNCIAQGTLFMLCGSLDEKGV